MWGKKSKFYHYLWMNPNTGKANEVWRQGFNTQGEARKELSEVIRDYEDGYRNTHAWNEKLRFEEVTNLSPIYYKNRLK